MSNNNASMRPAKPEELDFTLRVREAAFRGYVEQIRPWDAADERRQHERRFCEQDFDIIELDGAAAGFVATVLYDSHLRVNQLMILPSFQGRGVGTRVLQAIVRRAAELKRPVRLQCLKANPRALAFYERQGFVEIGTDETHVLLESKPPALS